MSSLKELHRMLSQAEVDLKTAKALQRETNDKVSALSDKIKSLKKQCEALKTREIIISDHAVVRYFERVEGFDIENIKAAICPDSAKKQIGVVRTGSFPVRSGEKNWKLKVKDGIVATLIADTEEEEKL